TRKPDALKPARMSRLVQRAVHGLLLLAAVSAFTFLLLSIAPGNSFDELRLNPQVSAETVAALKLQYGTDRPWPDGYGRWVLALARGDFGYSTSYHQAVGSLLWIRARNTLLLTTLAMLVAWAVALPWGVLEALYRGKWVDRAGALVTAALLAVPDALLA